MRTLYQQCNTPEDVIPAIKEMNRLREQEDVSDWINLPNIFVSGRSSNRVPTSATDVIAGDNLGDIVNDATYEYKLLNISGTLKWDRRSLNTSW